jgi:hypothetical protein
MANRKITELTALTGANATDTDVFAIVDVSADETKKMTLGELKEAFDSGSGFVRITGDTMTGDLALSGADVTFGDNDKALFGAGSDLQIYHDGTNSHIREAGAGQLYIRAYDGINLQTTAGENYFTGTADGASTIYYNNSAKLATTSTGVDITGTLTSDALRVETAQGNISIENSASSLNFARAGGNYIRALDASGNFTFITGANDFTTARLKIENNGDISFYDSSGNPSFVYDASAGSTFNEQGADRDFRVESDGSSHMLFVDASSNAVGINTSAPEATLHVRGLSNTTNGDAVIRLDEYNYSHAGADVVGGGIDWYGGDASSPGYDTRRAFIRTKSDDQYNRIGLSFGTARNDSIAQERFRLNAQGGATFWPSSAASYGNTFVWNQDGNDADFRVESDGGSHALFVDASANKVAIGTSDTTGVSGNGLKVKSNQVGTASAAALALEGSGGDFRPIVFHNSATDHVSFYSVNSSSPNYIATQWTDSALFYNGDTRHIQRSNGSQNFYPVTGGLFVWNDDGNDADFRVESDNHSHMLFVDAGADKVFIGSSTAATNGTRLNVTDTAQTTWVGTATEGIQNISLINNTQTSAQHAGLSFRVSTNDTSNNAQGAISLVQPLWSSHASRFEFNLRADSGARYNYMSIYSQEGTIFNETGANYQDFRVESDSNSNMLFVDAGNNRVGIGTSAPGSMLTVNEGGIRVVGDHWSSSDPLQNSFAAYDGTYGGYAFGNGTNSSTLWGVHDTNNSNDPWAVLNFDNDGAYITVNQDGYNCDFNIESNGNSNAVYLDANFSSGLGCFVIGTNNTSSTSGVGHKWHPSSSQYVQYIVIDSSAATNYPFGIYNQNATYNGTRFKLQVNGGLANFSANNVNLSDARKKRDIAPLADGYLDKICAIPVKTFNYIDDPADDEPNIGVIAQDVEAVAPELVNHKWDYDNDGNFIDTFGDGVPTKAVYSDDIVYSLMKALQELKAKNDALEAKVTALENA